MPSAPCILTRTFLDTALGPMLTVVSPDGLCGLEFDRPERSTRLWRRLSRYLPGHLVEGLRPGTDASRTVALTEAWLQGYFATGRDPEQAVPLHLVGTSFEQEVWRLLRTIVAGESRAYAWVARELRRPDAARAVGAAVGANPVSLIVPCHRVVGTNGSLTGYGGGMDRKQWLLRHEGTRGIAGELFLDRTAG